MLDVSQLQVSLAAVKASLHSDEIINHLKTQLSDPTVQAKLADERVQSTQTLAGDTISAYKSFDQAKSTLTQLGDNKGSWPSKWQNVFTVGEMFAGCVPYSTLVRTTSRRSGHRSVSTRKGYRSLAVSTQEGVSCRISSTSTGFNSNIVQRLDWDEAHFEEAKALITKYLQVSCYLAGTRSNLTAPILGSSGSSSRNGIF